MLITEQYRKIAEYFEKALNGLPIEPALDGAIIVMRTCPEKLGECFNNTLWELIEAVCNENVIPTKDEERWDFFLAGCHLLDKIPKITLKEKEK